uniref:Triple gene block 2 n=1 Tax=Cymbidium mosaic virus TaxID=12178 RepID=A0A8F0WNK8_9VIRU|nr:hypothetical protein [Cymbidium mosaic virus]
MPGLVPPPDHSKSLFVLAIGITVVSALFVLKSHTFPIAGDNIHRFPSGGQYKDGTKQINYCPPTHARYPKYPDHKWLAATAAIVIPLCLYISYHPGNNIRRICPCCNTYHHP